MTEADIPKTWKNVVAQFMGRLCLITEQLQELRSRI